MPSRPPDWRGSRWQNSKQTIYKFCCRVVAAWVAARTCFRCARERFVVRCCRTALRAIFADASRRLRPHLTSHSTRNAAQFQFRRERDLCVRSEVADRRAPGLERSRNGTWDRTLLRNCTSRITAPRSIADIHATSHLFSAILTYSPLWLASLRPARVRTRPTSQRSATVQGRRNLPWAPAASGSFTSACGITVYTGNAFPAEYLDNAFIAEPANNLVHRRTPSPRFIPSCQSACG